MKTLILIPILAFLFISTASAYYEGTGGGYSGLDDILGNAVDGDVVNTAAPSIDEAVTPVEKVELLFLHVVELILYVIGIGAVVMIVVAGVRMTFSAGSEEAIDWSKKTITFAVIGLLVAFLALAIVRTVLKLFFGDEL